MGLNSVFMILNDQYHEINDNPRVFWRRAWEGLQRSSELPFDFGLGKAIAQHHSDYTSLIAVGGNYATVLAMVDTGRHHLLEDKVHILNAAAEKLGYKLTKIAMRQCDNCGEKTRRFKYVTEAMDKKAKVPLGPGDIVCLGCFERLS